MSSNTHRTPGRTPRMTTAARAFGTSQEETDATGGMWPGLLDAKYVARVGSMTEALRLLDETLLYCHREKQGRHIYFLANCDAEPVERTVTLRGSVSELWHPTTGEQRSIEVSERGELTEVRLTLAAYGGVFLI